MYFLARGSAACLRTSRLPGWSGALVKRLVDVYHDRGIKCIYHSDGNLNPVMKDLAATGIDGINPLETLAGMSLADVRERIPGLAIAGGRRFLMGPTTELLPGVQVPNVLAVIETARTYRPA
jgi:hypothetical protein